MKLVFRYPNGIECWLIDGEYYVYGVTMSGDPCVVPSEGMAREIAHV